MFFFFPFIAEPAAAPAPYKVQSYKPLPMLPAPRCSAAKARPAEDVLGSAVSQAGLLVADCLKQALSSIASSMTALGNRANAFFAQIAAGLAFERMARETTAFFGMFWPNLVQRQPQAGLAAPWHAFAPAPALYSPFSLPGFSQGVPAANPWALFTEAANMWTRFWLPAQPQPRRGAFAPAPITATIALPGCFWSFALGA